MPEIQVMREIPFKCPKCHSESFEEILVDVTVATQCRLFEDEDEIKIRYGNADNSDGHVDRYQYQCRSCGYTILASGTLDELAEALKKLNVPVKKGDLVSHNELVMGEIPNRTVEMYRLSDGEDTGTWDTVMVELPADTPDYRLEEVARTHAAAQYGEGAYLMYNSMDDECPKVERGPERLRAVVILEFDADQLTVGSKEEQEIAAVELVNLTLQREPYGLGANVRRPG